MLKKEKEERKKDFTGLKVLETLAATGLRSVRYCKEIGTRAGMDDVKVSHIVANDWDPEASNSIKSNFEFNGIETSHEIQTMDGIDLMYEKRKNKERFDVVDLDPYGTAVPFLDGAV